MAEMLLTFVVEQILEKVGSTAIQEIVGFWRLKKDLQKLSEFTQSIHGKVQEARNNQAADGQAIKSLLVKLLDILYYAEDVLDEFSYEFLRRKIEIRHQLRMRISGFASRNNPIFFNLKMACKMKKINQSLDDIEKQALRELAFTGKAVADPVVVSTDQLDRVTVSYFDKSAPSVIGRAREVEVIINMLQQVSSSTPSPLTVVSIVGFGGIGKTTLAKMVLHEVEKAKLFDETIWVCVSESFDAKKILKGMLETLDENAGGLDNVDAILRHLKRKLEDKKFFLVLDDVWEDNCIKCNNLKSHLLTICNKVGNFVVVTTRSSKVANAMDTQQEHVVRLKGLEEKECWEIIREKCLLQWEGSMPEELEKIGVDVAKKCKGVPLAAKVVGGTLCKKKNREEWLSIKNSGAWEEIDEDNEIFPVLKLSFHHLNPSLKQCFVYCSTYPKDFEYDKQKLIELWMAEGFLNTRSTNPGSKLKSMEDVGDEYFNGLVVHSFFQDVEVDTSGNIISCKMHDLLHDLATSISNYKSLSLKHGSVWIDIVSRTSAHQHDPSAEELESSGAKDVRYIICKPFYNFYESICTFQSGRAPAINPKFVGDVSHMFFTFKSLRSVDISDANLKELPSAIGRLKHLRYLDISRNQDIKELPESITKLYNLQTLHIKWCLNIRMLPTNMVNLVRLRHIHFDNLDLKIYKVGRLTELHTLQHFEVRSEEGFQIEELKNLKELRGKLSIRGLQNVRGREEADGADLKDKKLTELDLEWEYFNLLGNENEENVLEGLLPPLSIKRLRIRGYMGVKFPNWMSMGMNNSLCQLSQLVELNLSNCWECEIMPSLGHFPCLKILNVFKLRSIRCIGSEFYGECKRGVTLFPQLKTFHLFFMESLEEWGAIKESSVEAFPLLEKVRILDCPRLRSIPLRHLSSLVTLSIGMCEDVEYLSNDLRSFPSLHHLEIMSCRNLASLSSMHGLVSLDYLGIVACPKLKSVPHWIKDSTSLRELRILDCEGLISIDNDIISSLSHLKKLSLGPFSEELEDFPGLNSIYHLSSSLDVLSLHGWEKLKSLPHKLQYLTSLQQLEIRRFKGLEALPDWLGNLSSLQRLQLHECHNLKNLPTTMKSLSNLRFLSSYGCPLLMQRYNQNTGPDRQDISHIAETYLL